MVAGDVGVSDRFAAAVAAPVRAAGDDDGVAPHRGGHARILTGRRPMPVRAAR